MCSCCRRDFNPNEWEVVGSCRDVLLRRIKRVRTTKQKRCAVRNGDGFFKVLAQNLACWGSYYGLWFVSYIKWKDKKGRERAISMLRSENTGTGLRGTRGTMQKRGAKQVSEKRWDVKNFEVIMAGKKNLIFSTAGDKVLRGKGRSALIATGDHVCTRVVDVEEQRGLVPLCPSQQLEVQIGSDGWQEAL